MELPDSISKALDDFVTEAKNVFGDRLTSIVLYGSAAEGRLRKTSDVNVVVVTQSFAAHDATALSPILSYALAAVNLQVMFLLQSELETASQLFAVKFSDISRRRRVLYGIDPFSSLQISKEALIARLRQVLLNHLLRVRYAFSLRSDSSEHLKQVLVESVSPLRASAAALLELRGDSFADSKNALEIVAEEIRDNGFKNSLSIISEAREGKEFGLEDIRMALSDVLEMTAGMKALIKSFA